MVRRRAFNTVPAEMQTLEGRIVLAGNVAAELASGLLTLDGDDLDNSIRVSQNAAGAVTVVGLNGTTINGVASVNFPNANLEQLEVKLFGGNDSVRMVNVSVNNDMVIDTGDGNDAAILRNTSTGANTSMVAGLGADRFQGNALSVQGDLNLDLDQGRAVVLLTNSAVVGSASIVTKDANDQVTLRDSTIGQDLVVETGVGSDRVTASNVSVGLSAKFETAEGIDFVTLRNVSTVEDLTIGTGTGNDRVTLTNVTSQKSISVNTDDGNDRVIATNVNAAIDAVFIGGAGVDIFDNNGVFGGVKLEILEFESII